MTSDEVVSDFDSSEFSDLESDAESSETIHETEAVCPEGMHGIDFCTSHCKADIVSEEAQDHEVIKDCDYAEELPECDQLKSYDNEGDDVSILSDQDTTGINYCA